jgi:hypothetical protein
LFDQDGLIRIEGRRIKMALEAECIRARLLGYTVEDHRADRGWLVKAAAKIILEQAEEIERLKAALGTKAEEWQPVPNGGEDHDRGRSSQTPPAISPLF